MTHPETNPATPEGDAISRARDAVERELSAPYAYSSFNTTIDGQPLTNNGETEFVTRKEFQRVVDDLCQRVRAAIRSLPPQDGERELEELRSQVEGYRTWGEDVKRLTRQIDVDMHGEEGAAKQASLCDLVGAGKDLRDRAEKAEARVVELEAENKRIGNLFDDLCHFTTPEQRRAYLTGGAAALTAQPVAQEPVAGAIRDGFGRTMVQFVTTPAPVEAGLREIEDMLTAGQGDDDGPAILPDIDGLSTVAKVEACLGLLERRRDAIAGFEAAFAPGTVANAARVLLDLLHVRGDHHNQLSREQVQGFYDEVAEKDGFEAVVAALNWLSALRAQSAPVGGEVKG